MQLASSSKSLSHSLTAYGMPGRGGYDRGWQYCIATGQSEPDASTLFLVIVISNVNLIFGPCLSSEILIF
jgi:hypothetical protein